MAEEGVGSRHEATRTHRATADGAVVESQRVPGHSDVVVGVGSVVQRYRVRGVAGEGGNGEVFVAYDPELDRKVALKFVRGTAPDDIARLLREAQALARLRHGNVVTIFDVGTHDGRVFLAMEYIEGRTLAQWLEERERSPSQIVEVLHAAGEGLAAAHAAELGHRDFKPTNVMIADDGQVVVVDFGLARGVDAIQTLPDLDVDPAAYRRAWLDETITDHDVLMGTRAYMAPEYFSGAGPLDLAKADQYAFCVSLHEALNGRPTSGRVELPEVVGDDRVATALRRGLSPNPDDRFDSMSSLLLALGGAQTPAIARETGTGGRWLLGLLAVAMVGAVGLKLATDRDEDVEGAMAPARAAQAPPPSDSRRAPVCAPLLAPSGGATRVTPAEVAHLPEIIAAAGDGDTLVFAPGRYDFATLGEPLSIGQRGLTLRSESGVPDSVVWEGGGRSQPFAVVRGQDARFAGFTMRGGARGAVWAVPQRPGDATGLRIYGMRFVDIDGVAVRASAAEDGSAHADGGSIRCSVFVRDTPPTSAERCGQTSAVRVYGGRNWRFERNRVEEYFCPGSESYAAAAVGFRGGARDSVVDANSFRNCSRPILLGETPGEAGRDWPDRPCGRREGWGHVGGLIRNNMVWTGMPHVRPDSMISVWNTCQARVAHNTVVLLGNGFNGIEHRFADTTVFIVNNLTNADIAARDGSQAVVEGNLVGADLDGFEDAFTGDLHLAPDSAAVGAALRKLGEVGPGLDIDGDARDDRPDIGADERRDR